MKNKILEFTNLKDRRIPIYLGCDYDQRIYSRLLDKNIVNPIVYDFLEKEIKGPYNTLKVDNSTHIQGYFLDTLNSQRDPLSSNRNLSFFRGLDNCITLNQYTEVVKMLMIKDYFKVPKFLYCRDHDTVMDFIKPNKNYVIKGLFVATGRSKFHFNSNDRIAMEKVDKYYNGYDEGVQKSYNKHYGKIKNLYRDRDSSYIMEDIGYENIREYRILFFKTGHFLIEKRSGYHPLDPKPRTHTVINYIPKELKPSFKRLLYIFRDITYRSSYPFCGFDLYVRMDRLYNRSRYRKYRFKDIYGLFEYCYTFGIDYPKEALDKLTYPYTQSLLEYCKEIKNKLPYKLTTEFKQITV